MNNAKKIAKAKAIESSNKKRILACNPNINDASGIYILTRCDEDGIRYAYIGQAKHILSRLANHLSAYQHIDLSLKRHGLWSGNNEFGWKIGAINFPESELDDKEKEYIRLYAIKGYQLRNKTAGGQGYGKRQIDEYRPAKTYRDGLARGYANASREIADLFKKHLEVSAKKDPPTVNQQKALDKFDSFLKFHETNK